MVEEGKGAQTFTPKSDAGEDVWLESLRGRGAVLYSYPRGDSRQATCSQDRFRRPHGYDV